jgi:hypothetical protein
VGQDNSSLLNVLGSKAKLSFLKSVIIAPFFDKRDFSTQLRFDSRIYLYRDSSIGFKLYEMYAIKGSPLVQPVLGN